VLQSFPAPRPTTNPYVVQLARCLRERDDVELTTFSWRAALLHRHDVLHVHWPETLLAGTSPARTAVRRLLFVLALLRWRLDRTAVVATVHNLRPHEGASPVARVLLRRLDRRVGVRIAINEHTPPPQRGGQHMVLHGHYRDWYADAPNPPAEPARLAAVGLVRPYKGIPSLVAVVRDAARHRSGIRLHVAGKAPDPADEAAVRAAAGDDPAVELSLRHQTDDELATAVRRASVVVLPYRDLFNSGAALLALSLDRPVLVPRNAVTDRLAEEVGAGWVLRYDGELAPEDVVAAVDAPVPAGRPDLDLRDWTRAAEAHVTAYRDAVGRRYSR